MEVTSGNEACAGKQSRLPAGGVCPPTTMMVASGQTPPAKPPRVLPWAWCPTPVSHRDAVDRQSTVHTAWRPMRRNSHVGCEGEARASALESARLRTCVKVCVQDTARGRKCPRDLTWYQPGAAARQRQHRGGTSASNARNHRVWDGRLRRRNTGSHGMSEQEPEVTSKSTGAYM